MGKLYVRSKTRTAVDGVRLALDQAERIVCDLDTAGPEAIELLHLLDEIEEGLHRFEQQDVNVRAERTRFETVQRRLERRPRAFLRQAGQVLEEERERVDPPRSRWWWYLDEAAAEQRWRKLRRVAVGALAVIVLLVGAWLGYQQFLAPPPEVGEAYERMGDGRSQTQQGDLEAALDDFNAATDLTPDDPEPWLWKGAIHHELGESAQAREAFATAERLYDSPFDFVLNRGRVYLQAGNVEKAKADVRAAIDLDPTSGWAYYLRAGTAVAESDYEAALTDLERAAELAEENGNRRLQAMATTQRAQLVQMLPMSAPD